MSRYSDGDDDYENCQLDFGRWEWNTRQALKSKRGRQALRELREALMALPEHRLIEGAVCTVGADTRRDRHAAEEVAAWEALDSRWRPPNPYTDQSEEFDRHVQKDGEGVCAVGALAWHRAVKAGAAPAEAFASLPDIPDEGSDGLDQTAELAKQRAGLTYTLAWNLAYRNDETYRRMTPEGRHAAFLAWIDAELAEAPGADVTVTALHPESAEAVRPHGITRYKHGPDEHGQPDTGCRCGTCSQASRDYENRRARMIAYGRWEARIDATGTRRRIQALMRNGWPLAPLGRHLGISRQSTRQMLSYARVSARTAEKVRVLYDSLWDQSPPEGTRYERTAATTARRYAAERGWPPPQAWDDDEIDAPAASPAEGWEPREGVRRWGVLGEDSAFLLAAGEEPWRVAERLGVSPKTLDTVLMRERQRAEPRRAA